MGVRQDEAIEILRAGRNVFLTGEPGAGKSWVIDRFAERTRRSVALDSLDRDCGHQYLRAHHSFVGWHRGELDALQVTALRDQEQPGRSRIRGADTLVVDEVSMLSGDTLEAIDNACRRPATSGISRSAACRSSWWAISSNSRPWSKPAPRYRFAFEAPVWQELDLAVCYITEQHRQADPAFMALLSLIRSGECDPASPELRRRQRSPRAPVDIPTSTRTMKPSTP